MAKQEGRDQQAQGSALTPSNRARTGMFPAAMMLAPGDLFRMGPFALMRRMGEEMDRVFGEFGMNRGESGKAGWAPVIEVSQSEGKYLVRAELPGMNSKDVKLEITDGAVILQGERTSEREEKKGSVHLTERQYGHFYRAIPLPEGAKGEEARAKFENGLLEVTVPVPEQKEKRREIPIEAAPSQPGAPGKAA